MAIKMHPFLKFWVSNLNIYTVYERVCVCVHVHTGAQLSSEAKRKKKTT